MLRADFVRVYGMQPRRWMPAGACPRVGGGEHDNQEVIPAKAGIQEPSIQLQAALGEGLVRTVSIAEPYAIGPQERCIFAVFFFSHPLYLCHDDSSQGWRVYPSSDTARANSICAAVVTLTRHPAAR
jgi:hypothetical protein